MLFISIIDYITCTYEKKKKKFVKTWKSVFIFYVICIYKIYTLETYVNNIYIISENYYSFNETFHHFTFLY